MLRISYKTKKLPEAPHNCEVNFIGSSGAMEAKFALELIQKVHTDVNGHIYICEIVSDDDSSMRKTLRHVSNSDGSLDVNIPEPVFSPT